MRKKRLKYLKDAFFAQYGRMPEKSKPNPDGTYQKSEWRVWKKAMSL